MGNLNSASYRRDYTGENITYVEDNTMKSVFVTPRNLPYDLNSRNAIVLGNGIGRLDPTVQLILGQNNKRVAEGYKLTYACNAAFRDTAADYYVIKHNTLFAEISSDDHNKMFTANDMWVTWRNTNLLPHCYHMDAGASAAYLAAFDGAQKIFLFGFDGTDGITSENIYADTSGYDSSTQIENFQKFNTYLYNVIHAFSSVQFYRVRNHHSNDFDSMLKSLPNYFEVSVRDAVLLGDF
jgi:hypothetical protein